MPDLNVVRFLALDSWRGIAALFVAFGHLKASGFLSSLSISTFSYRFVDFFFVLSGFVIAHSTSRAMIKNSSDFFQFLAKRIARLWPLHIFVLSFFAFHQIILFFASGQGFVSGHEAFSGGFSVQYLFHNVFLIQAWGGLPEASWNEPAWSISTEMFAYIAFASLSLFVGSAHLRVIHIFSLFILLYVFFNPDVMKATYSGALTRCAAGFFLGVVVYAWYFRFRKLRFRLPSIVELGVIVSAFLAITMLPQDMGGFVLPVFAVTIFVFAFEQGAVSAFLKSGIFVCLGERSYSIYLNHAFIALAVYSIAAVFGFLGRLPNGNTGIALEDGLGDFLILSYLCFVVIVSHWTYGKIEIPGQVFGRKVLEGRCRASAEL